MQPTYYVRHHDGSYSVASPQPISAAPAEGQTRKYTDAEMLLVSGVFPPRAIPPAAPSQGKPSPQTPAETEDALVKRLRDTPNWLRQDFGSWKDATNHYDRAPFEAADLIERQQARIAELERAAPSAQVPREPTEAMQRAMVDAMFDEGGDLKWRELAKIARKGWRAAYDTAMPAKVDGGAKERLGLWQVQGYTATDAAQPRSAPAEDKP